MSQMKVPGRGISFEEGDSAVGLLRADFCNRAALEVDVCLELPLARLVCLASNYAEI